MFSDAVRKERLINEKIMHCNSSVIDLYITYCLKIIIFAVFFKQRKISSNDNIPNCHSDARMRLFCLWRIC